MKPYPSRYTKAGDIEKPTLAMITTVGHETMQDGKTKPCVNTDAFSKPIIVNATNADILYEMAGTDDDVDWPGLTVELYVAEVRSPKGGTVPSICFRRPPQRKANKKEAAAKMATAVADDTPEFLPSLTILAIGVTKKSLLKLKPSPGAPCKEATRANF